MAEHAVAVDYPRLDRGTAEVWSFGRLGDDGAAEREDPDHGGVFGRDEILQRRFDADDLKGPGVDFDAQLRGKLWGGVRPLTVEVRADAAHRQRAYGYREAAQDHEREQRRDAGQAYADRQPVEGRGQLD